MDDTTIERLLHEPEGPGLDFKRGQYPFTIASDSEKAELLKDILAFANSWRRCTAYVLIGVQEVKGGRSTPLGITEHLNDHHLQQFVNSKTNRPISFQYLVHPFQGIQLGIIEIPVQERPFYLKKAFGGLATHAVYVRRGSSTDTADPDEVAKMAVATVEARQVATLTLQWGEPDTRRLLGAATQLQVEVLDPVLPESAAEPPRSWIVTTAEMMRERDYGAKLLAFAFERGLHRPLFLVCQNAGQVAATNVVTTGTVRKITSVRLAEYAPEPPRESTLELRPLHFRYPMRRAYPHIDAHADHWTVKLEFGAVLPGQTKWAEEPLWIGANHSMRIDLDLHTMAENIPTPLATPLAVDVSASVRPMKESDLDRSE